MKVKHIFDMSRTLTSFFLIPLCVASTFLPTIPPVGSPLSFSPAFLDFSFLGQEHDSHVTGAMHGCALHHVCKHDICIP
eukprot:jgi/Botrbrau1/6005/Bobra.104_1s0033.1